MGNILYYLAHDPVGNCEWQVSDFDRSALAKNAENNIVFIAVDESGNREIVDAFLSTGFGGGRHAGRVEKIAALENE